jgi:hypothetical protein
MQAPNVSIASPEITKLINASQSAAAAALAGGVIAAAGRPFSTEEAMAVFNDMYFSLNRHPGDGRYDMWKNTHDPKKVHV